MTVEPAVRPSGCLASLPPHEAAATTRPAHFADLLPMYGAG
jgi:hypothetical protein